jgi:RNA-directed DNA polymerase
VLQVLHPAWDTTVAEASSGFCPARLAHQAVARAQQSLEAGDAWVVDLALAKFFDRVPHDRLLSLVKGRIAARRVGQCIARYRKAGVLRGDGFEATGEGTPPGGPWSPLVAHLLLDGFDKALERRGHRFVRDADDSNIYVQSLRAGHAACPGSVSWTACDSPSTGGTPTFALPQGSRAARSSPRGATVDSGATSGSNGGGGVPGTSAAVG